MKTIKILFVCKGNICRSTMAQFLMAHKFRENNIEKYCYIDSAATTDEQIGKNIAPGTIQKLEENHIEYEEHHARQITVEDYKNFDYIIAMDNLIINDIYEMVEKDMDYKIFRLYDFSTEKFDIVDPIYTNDFDRTYREINFGCDMFLKYLQKKYKLLKATN